MTRLYRATVNIVAFNRQVEDCIKLESSPCNRIEVEAIFRRMMEIEGAIGGGLEFRIQGLPDWYIYEPNDDDEPEAT
jgi:hypothetical protein